jgi:hypothetical protein
MIAENEISIENNETQIHTLVLNAINQFLSFRGYGRVIHTLK